MLLRRENAGESLLFLYRDLFLPALLLVVEAFIDILGLEVRQLHSIDCAGGGLMR